MYICTVLREDAITLKALLGSDDYPFGVSRFWQGNDKSKLS